MAVADLIGAAVGVMLLVIVAYLLVGSTLSTAEIVTSAQKATALQEQTQLRTDFTIGDVVWDGFNINCTINNTGKEIISDLNIWMLLSIHQVQDIRYTPIAQQRRQEPGQSSIEGRK